MAQLMKAVLNLRAPAMFRTYDVHRAEDLVQETILRAWDERSSFERGTNLAAWLLAILRDEFFSSC
ncbi:sigma factor [Microvirga vignae]|uniref:sigma factor n=1 Tax=Microvirga vignae TaxID=1225564 RepID=UPI00069C0B60|nr:sigma factor [Microvirga vignae]